MTDDLRKLGFDVYQVYTEPGRTEDGAVLEWWDGCNGLRHASTLQKVFLDANGQAKHAETLPALVRGSCDGTCAGRKRVGGFLLNSQVEKITDALPEYRG